MLTASRSGGSSGLSRADIAFLQPGPPKPGAKVPVELPASIESFRRLTGRLCFGFRFREVGIAKMVRQNVLPIPSFRSTPC
jgi:hypothetical protein